MARILTHHGLKALVTDLGGGWLRRDLTGGGTQVFRNDRSGLFVEHCITGPGGTTLHWQVVRRPNNATGEPITVIAGPFPDLRPAQVVYVMEAARG